MVEKKIRTKIRTQLLPFCLSGGSKFAGPLALGVSDNQNDVLPLGPFRLFSALRLLSSWFVRHFLPFVLFLLGPFVIFCSFPLVPSSFSALSPSSISSFGRPGAKMGAAQRGPRRPGPPVRGRRTRPCLRLNFVIFFDPVFDRFWTVLDPQDGSKIDQTSVPKSMFLWIGF